MDIGAIGWWHHDNHGDWAMLNALTHAMKPHRIVPIDTGFEVNEDTLYRLNRLDFLILGGGTLMRERPVEPFDRFDSWGEYLTTPIGIAGMGVETVAPNYADAMGALLDKSEFFYVRDQTSLALLDHPKARYAPDLTFSQPLPIAGARSVVEGRSPLCGVNLRRLPGDVLTNWIDVLQQLPVEFRGISLSSHPEFSEGGLLRQLDPQYPDGFDPRSYADLNLMIGTAFHSVVYAIQSAIPVIAIAYAPKVRRLMTDIGLGDFVLEPTEWDLLPGLVQTAIERQEEMAERLRETTTELTRAANANATAIKEHIEAVAQPHERLGPRVSIAVLVTGSDEETRRTIQSCLDQTHENVEVVVVANQAGEPELGTEHSDQIRIIRMERESEAGDLLQAGLLEADGCYVTWIRSGDRFTRDAIDCMVSWLEADSMCDMVYSDYFVTGGHDRILDWQVVHPAYKLFRRNVVGPCFLLRTSLMSDLGMHHATSLLPDYDYWLRAQNEGELEPRHTRLFYRHISNGAIDDPVEEQQVRREWIAGLPLSRQVVWRVRDNNFINQQVIPWSMAAARNVAGTLKQSRRDQD
ncbi:MAG: polysaccharide pyruvyl transferase family protein [Chloroflexota bacterium]|nr:polysaccharide pyruvyl transferase family protein [Chloroflexota bacterium]